MRMTGGTGRMIASAPPMTPPPDPEPVRSPAGGAAGRNGAGQAASTAAAAPVTDEALAEQLRDGDVAAGETLVKRHFEPLMRYLQRLAGPQVAEELHQQTWLSVLDHIE